MPNWKIHLEVGKRLNKYLNLKDNQYNEFLLGNILPDINNSYIVSDIKVRIGHDITHFDDKRDYKHHLAFINKYQSKIKEPIYLGYYVHLYTDYLFNRDFYDLVRDRKITNIEKDKLRMIKQDDFKVFNNKYIDNTIKIDNIGNILRKIDIEEVNVCESDLLNIINYLNNTPLFNGTYQIYQEEELDKLLDKVIVIIKNDLESIFNKGEK